MKRNNVISDIYANHIVSFF